MAVEIYGPHGPIGPTGPAGPAGADGVINQLKDEGVNVPQRAAVDFVGAGVTVTDDATGGAEKTIVTIPGGGGASSSAVLVDRSTVQSIPHNTLTAISWDTERYDDNNFWAAGAPTRLTVPAGVTRVRLTGVAAWPGAATDTERFARFHKNGAYVPGVGYSVVPSAVTATALNMVSAPLAVVAGDYFELVVRHQHGSNFDVSTASWFSMEVLA